MANLLQVHVVWHPAFDKADRYAKPILGFFQRDSEHPLIRGLGIPVFFWTSPDAAGGPPDPLPLDQATHNAVVLLFDAHFANDDAWRRFAETTQDALLARGRADRIFVVLFDPADTGRLPANLADVQGIPLWDVTIEANRIRKVLVRMSVSLSRLLGSLSEERASVKLFLSHAKADESLLALAALFRDYLRKTAPYQTFYDAQDLIAGEDFKEQLEENVGESALIVFQTDAYSSRPVCQYELLTARYADRPIVNVYAVANGELRVFPYLGNVPSIRYAAEIVEPYGPVLDLVTFELFRSLYLRILLKAVAAGDPSLQGLRVLSRPPDLVACVHFRERGFLYPDPPISQYELDLLRKLDAQRVFVTPDSRPLVQTGTTP